MPTPDHEREGEPGARNRARVGQVGRAAADWPTTQRFSRRVGEAVRGAAYAAAIERPVGRAHAWLVPSTIIVALLAGAVCVAWGMA